MALENFIEQCQDCGGHQHSKKAVCSEHGEIELSVTHDRTGEFSPGIVKKHQKEVTGIEDQNLALHAKGVSVRDIQDHLSGLHGVDISPTLISNVTHIMPLAATSLNENRGRSISFLCSPGLRQRKARPADTPLKAEYRLDLFR